MLQHYGSYRHLALTCLSCLAFPIAAYAATDPANRLLDEQRNAARLEQLSSPAPASIPAVPALDADPQSIPELGPVIPNPTVRVLTNDLIPQTIVDDTLAPYASLELGKERLTLLIRQLTARLVEAGWVTSRAAVTGLSQRDGTVNIELIPGRIEAIRANALTTLALERAMPLSDGDVLSIEALEQGLQQINRLRMFDARIKILPGSAAFSDIVDLNMNPGRNWRVSVGIDNQGQQSTGTGRARIQAHTENTFGLLEDIQLAYLRSERSEVLLGSIALPDGFNTWSATVSASRSSIPLYGFEYETHSSTIALGFNRVLRLNREGRDAFDLTLLRARSARRYGPIDLKTDRTTVIRAAWTRLTRGARSQFYVEPAIAVGLAALGAIKDESDLDKTDTHHQFVKYGINAGAVAILNVSTEYAAQLQAQRSHLSLAGLEQISLGGLASVRGFRDASLSGDTGYALRQELRFPGAISAASALTPYTHLDVGTVWLTGATRRSLSSLGAGVRYSADGLIAEAVISAPLRRTPLNDDHSWRLHAQLAYEF